LNTFETEVVFAAFLDVNVSSHRVVTEMLTRAVSNKLELLFFS